MKLTDFNDLHLLRGLPAVKVCIEKAVSPSAGDEPRTIASGIKVVDAYELLKMDVPPRKNLLEPIIKEQSLLMIHGWRGVGKTHVSLGIPYAVSSGGKFLKWQAPEPRKIFFIDGEMPLSALQERIASIATMSVKEPPEGYFKVLTPDLQNGAMPDLGTKDGQAIVDCLIEPDTALIVIDNLSCLVRSGGRENEAESWLSVAEWALQHRAAGRSILFIHHSGKNGNQRGTSKREDLLDVVLSLRHPKDYNPSEGCHFEIAFEKCRGLFGGEVRSFEASLGTDEEGKPCWTMKDAEDGTLSRCVELYKLGLRQSEIAAELGVNRSTVCRSLKKAEQEKMIVLKD